MGRKLYEPSENLLYFMDLHNCRQLMRFQIWPNVVMLGFDRLACQVVWDYVGDFNMFTIWANEDEDSIKEWAESLYEEYGLMSTVKGDAGSYLELDFQMKDERLLPITVLDFSGQDQVHITGLKRGSVWIDMGASDEKEKYFAKMKGSISYFSLKTRLFLDTCQKNKYNTLVN